MRKFLFKINTQLSFQFQAILIDSKNNKAESVKDSLLKITLLSTLDRMRLYKTL